jgi:nucleoside-diphosphate-sugar epimerase
VPVTVLRPFNTYGPRQSARAVIPTILSQILAGRTTLRLGNLAPRRDLTYVSDTVAGFLAAGLASGIEGRTIQLGTGRAESVAEVVRAAAAACGVEVCVEQEAGRVRPQESEVMVLQSDPSLAADLLGWRAEVTLETGLARTAEWVRLNPQHFRPEEYAV